MVTHALDWSLFCDKKGNNMIALERLNTITLAHHLMTQYIKEGACCIDATAGRGFDTAFLCELVGDSGQVLAFDIQEDAVKSTRDLLEERGFKAEVRLESHVNMNRYKAAESVDGIMFNFGYLPGGDHTICTHAESSIAAITCGLELLKKKGVMSLCIYHGGDTGFEEKNELMAYLKTLDTKKYTVIVSELYNRPNYPPLSVFITKDK